MRTYHATATREDGWWVVLADLGTRTVGTQCRRLDQTESSLREAVAMALDVPEDAFAVDIRPVVDEELTALVEQSRELAAAAETAQREASERRHAVAVALKERGFTVRDAGMLMGISSQRVSQLLAS